MSEPVIILVRERLRDSLISDAVTFSLAALLVGGGQLIGATAGAWIGGIIFALHGLSKVINAIQRNTYTPEEARRRIEQIIAERSVGGQS